jgi:ribosome maturation factor RimP
MTDTAQRLWSVVEPYLAAEQVELDDIEIRGGESRILRVVVDAPGGVDIGRIADLSRGVARLLESTDETLTQYTLEVSSPGLERKLRRPRHYEKAVGRIVKVRTKSEHGGRHSHVGPVVAATDTGFTIEVDGETQTIDYGDVLTAATVFEWKASPKPGKQKAKKPAGAAKKPAGAAKKHAGAAKKHAGAAKKNV